MIIPWAAVICVCSAAAVWDVLYRRIPNYLTIPALLAGLLWAGATGGWEGSGQAFVASLLMGLPFVVMFVLALGGAGDAKLMAAVGAWLGVRDGLSALIWVVICGGLIGIVFALVRKRLPDVFRNLAGMASGLLVTVGFARHGVGWVGGLPETPSMVRMPYALAILAGVCLAAGGLELWR
jgi:prepilin peptidase CpaA